MTTLAYLVQYAYADFTTWATEFTLPQIVSAVVTFVLLFFFRKLYLKVTISGKVRDKKLDLIILQHEAMTETLGTPDINFGQKFKTQYESNFRKKRAEYDFLLPDND